MGLFGESAKETARIAEKKVDIVHEQVLALKGIVEIQEKQIEALRQQFAELNRLVLRAGNV